MKMSCEVGAWERARLARMCLRFHEACGRDARGLGYFRSRILDPDSDTDPDIRWSSGLFSKRAEVN